MKKRDEVGKEVSGEVKGTNRKNGGKGQGVLSWIIRLVALISISGLVVLPHLFDFEYEREYIKRFEKVEKEHREAIYGYNKLVDEVRTDGVMSDEVRKGMIEHLATLSESDLELLVRSTDIFDISRYVLESGDDKVNEDKVYTGEFIVPILILEKGMDMDDAELEVFSEEGSKLATDAWESVGIDRATFNSHVTVFYYLFVFFIAMPVSLYFILYGSIRDDEDISDFVEESQRPEDKKSKE